MALGAVDEDRDRKKIGDDRQLAAGEDGPAGDAELVSARLALPKLAGRDLIGDAAGALRANGFALGRGPADHAEGVVGLLVRHASNPS